MTKDYARRILIAHDKFCKHESYSYNPIKTIKEAIASLTDRELRETATRICETERSFVIAFPDLCLPVLLKVGY